MQFAIISVQAQNKFWIPDNNFRNYLKMQIPLGFDANDSLITNSSAVLGLNFIDLYNTGVNDIAGIEYFIGLDTLSYQAGFNQKLNYIPDSLPNSLKYIKLSYHWSTSFVSNLPDSLEYLDISSNQITQLPTLPSKLKYLDCYENKLTSLPALPIGLTHLDFSTNLILNFPVLPPNIEFLNCSDTKVTTYPTFPSTLRHFDCSANNLTSLPIIPMEIEHFIASQIN